jgi:hypothetical protein
VREGFVSVEHLKRYTTLGMATDQGRTSNVNGLAILADLTGRTIPETGSTPPGRRTPVAIGAFAGHHTRPHFRPTPPHRLPRLGEGAGRRLRRGGRLVRAQYFPQTRARTG